jgi:hypothetical protein
MNVKRSLKVVTVTMVLFLAALSPCYAARIYNDTNAGIYVGGNTGGLGTWYWTVVQPGQRSSSLDWTTVTEVTASSDNKTLCHLGFGPHAQIQGGNYMVVSSSGNNTNCVVCDSNHSSIAGSGSC